MPTFRALKQELEQHGSLISLSNAGGIYKVYLPRDFELLINSTTDAISTYQGRSQLYPAQRLQQKYAKICSISSIDGEDRRLLYVGKAEHSKGRGLRKRVTEFVQYGYGACSNHRGGRAIWQLQNNKELLIELLECQNPASQETQELERYKAKYGAYPFANWRK